MRSERIAACRSAYLVWNSHVWRIQAHRKSEYWLSVLVWFSLSLAQKVIVSYLQHLLELYYYKFAYLIVLLFLVVLVLGYLFFRK